MPPVVRVKKRARAQAPSSNELPAFMTPAAPAIEEQPERMQSLMWPAGDYAGEFVEPTIPSGLFSIKYDGQDDQTEGPYDGSNFITDADTNIAYSRNGDGSPVFIRCTDQEGSHMDVIHGDGTVGTMDILPYNPDEES